MQATMSSGSVTDKRRVQIPDRPWTTYLLLLSIIVALFGEAYFALQGMGLNAFLHTYGLVSADFSWADPRSYVTLLTFNFLHSGARHFAGNAIILLVAGAAVEKYVGWRATFLIWMAGGAASGVVHLLMFPDTERTLVGASGAIAALLGAALVLGWKWALPVKLWPGRRTLFHVPLPLVTFIWVGFQMYGVVQIYRGTVSDPSVATWVHLAGFMFGVCAAGVLQIVRNPNPVAVPYYSNTSTSGD